MFTFSTKREIRQFHVVVVQRRQRNVPKKRRVPLSSLLETFGMDDGDSSENAVYKKMAFFKLCLFYDFLETALKFKKRKKISPSLVYVLRNKMKLGISTS